MLGSGINKRLEEGEFRGDDLWDPLENEAGEELRLQQVVYYRSGEETGGMDLEERRES